MTTHIRRPCGFTCHGSGYPYYRNRKINKNERNEKNLRNSHLGLPWRPEHAENSCRHPSQLICVIISGLHFKVSIRKSGEIRFSNTVHFLIMHNVGDRILLCIMRFMQQEIGHVMVTTVTWLGKRDKTDFLS